MFDVFGEFDSYMEINMAAEGMKEEGDVKSLREMGYHVVEPKGTFYLFPRTFIEDDVAFCEKAKDFDLLIVPGTGFGCPGHTRISFCVPTERIEKSLAAFQKLADFYKK